MYPFLLVLTLLLIPSFAFPKSIELQFRPDVPPHQRREIRDFIRAEARGSTPKAQALEQLTRDYGKMIAHLSEPKLAVRNAKQVLKSEFCVRFIFGRSGYQTAAKLHGLILNTHTRSKIGIRMNTYLTRALPYALDPKDWRNECRFIKRSTP